MNCSLHHDPPDRYKAKSSDTVTYQRDMI